MIRLTDKQSPWDTYVLVPNPRPYRTSRIRAIFAVLSILAVVTGGLIAWSQTQ